MSLVSFHELDIISGLKFRKALKEFIPGLFESEKKALGQLTVIFCSDEHLLQMNRQYLKHDYYTDIITFDISDSQEVKGELYISVDRILENSRKIEVNKQLEFQRVIFHGSLHLCGYKDKTKKDKQLMTQKEDEYLTKFTEFHVKQ